MARKSKRQPRLIDISPELLGVYNVGVYLRLSAEEKRDNPDRESIEYQKQICLSYLQDRPEMILHDIYVDNGETGTNFERDDFQRMMYDIYNGKINCIVVKDLSRFGREYIEMGDYVEKVFPLLGVRFIAVNDRVDNEATPLDISVPIKNVINSMYAKDLSKKSASALRMKQLNGEFVGGPAPFGYVKSEEDKHKFVIDPEAAEIVKLIFKLKMQKMGNMTIARRLFEMGIPTPSKYKYDKGLVKHKKYAESLYWHTGTVSKILKSEAYIGNMVQGKTKSHFFDGMPNEYVDRKDWIVIENTHQPIIPKEVFYAVQEILQAEKEKFEATHKGSKSSEKSNILKGLVVCGECGHNTKRMKCKDGNFRYTCTTHMNFPTECSMTSINESVLKNIVMQSVKSQMSAVLNLETAIQKALYSTEVKQEAVTLKNRTDQALANIIYLKSNRVRLTADFAKGLLDETEYEIAREQFEAELRTENDTLETCNKAREKFNKLLSAEKWIAELKKHTTAKRLNAEIVNAFIKQIRIYLDKRIEIVWKYDECFSEYLSMLNGGESLAG